MNPDRDGSMMVVVLGVLAADYAPIAAVIGSEHADDRLRAVGVLAWPRRRGRSLFDNFRLISMPGSLPRRRRSRSGPASGPVG